MLNIIQVIIKIFMLELNTMTEKVKELTMEISSLQKAPKDTEENSNPLSEFLLRFQQLNPEIVEDYKLRKADGKVDKNLIQLSEEYVKK